jgi:hypothetical protein
MATCDAQLLRIDEPHVGAPVVRPSGPPVPDVGAATSATAEQAATHVGAATPATADPAATHVGAAPSMGGKRATRSIAPATRRHVLRRDNGRCRATNCRNHVWLDVHHIRPRAAGGSHSPSNLLTLCGAHHAQHHRGLLRIEGATESEVRFTHADGTPYGAPPRPAGSVAADDAMAALRSLGLSRSEATEALAAARAHVGQGAALEERIREALRHHHLKRRAA